MTPVAVAGAGVRPAAAERPDRDLVAAVRAGLAAIEPARACCRAAERAGLGAAAEGRARSPAIARLAVRLEAAPDPVREPFEWSRARHHCRTAYLRGVFLAHGSLSLAGGRTHLELVVPSDHAAELVRRLNDVGLPASWRMRRGVGVVTWKGTERVLAFLRQAGASASVLELEARIVNRTLRGHLNRVINAETANLRRSVASTAQQIDAIRSLERSGELARMPEATQTIARARLDAPEASLTELAAGVGASRSLVQRALEQIRSAAARSDAREPAP